MCGCSPYKKVFVSKFLYKNFEGIFHYFSMISWNKNLNSHFLSENIDLDIGRLQPTSKVLFPEALE